MVGIGGLAPSARHWAGGRDRVRQCRGRGSRGEAAALRGGGVQPRSRPSQPSRGSGREDLQGLSHQRGGVTGLRGLSTRPSLLPGVPGSPLGLPRTHLHPFFWKLVFRLCSVFCLSPPPFLCPLCLSSCLGKSIFCGRRGSPGLSPSRVPCAHTPTICFAPRSHTVACSCSCFGSFRVHLL